MATPIRIGVLNDISATPSDMGNIEPWLRRVVDEVSAAGRIAHPVEFVFAWGLGLPAGTAEAVERAYAELVAKDVLLIVGPLVGDNALIATPLAERHRTPTINWAGAERARGDYMFHLQVGSHEDESVVLARHLAGLGVRRIGVVYDRSPIGERHLAFLDAEAKVLRLEVVAAEGISPLAEDASTEVDRVLAAHVDAFVYFGLGLSAPAVARPLTARGWTGPRAMNTAGLRGYGKEFGRIIDGWIYVDMWSNHNLTLAALCRRLNVPVAGNGPLNAAKGYDLGRLVAEAIARAPQFSRDGLKHGLEQIKWLPAAEGHEGTLLGFGHQDRGALHGRYLVLRQWRDGESVEV